MGTQPVVLDAQARLKRTKMVDGLAHVKAWALTGSGIHETILSSCFVELAQGNAQVSAEISAAGTEGSLESCLETQLLRIWSGLRHQPGSAM